MISSQRSGKQVGDLIVDNLLGLTSNAVETVRLRKRFRTDTGLARDKFNLSNDNFYEVTKEGGRHRVRQTFGQLVVEHAYPAQKLQLPFASAFLVVLVVFH